MKSPFNLSDGGRFYKSDGQIVAHTPPTAATAPADTPAPVDTLEPATDPAEQDPPAPQAPADPPQTPTARAPTRRRRNPKE